jgi:hypothetical protein
VTAKNGGDPLCRHRIATGWGIRRITGKQR